MSLPISSATAWIGSANTLPSARPNIAPTSTLPSSTFTQDTLARSTRASAKAPSSTSRARGSPNHHQPRAGSRAQARIARASPRPRRSSTRLPAAALSQNSIGSNAPPATTRMAWVRPRMMKSASARMLVYPCLVDGGVLATVAVGVGQQGQGAGALDGGGQLTLVLGFGSGDTARNDLAGFGDVGLQGVEILEVDLLHAFGGETAELTTAEETCHGLGSSIDPVITRQRCRCRCRCCRRNRLRWFRRARDAHGARCGFLRP